MMGLWICEVAAKRGITQRVWTTNALYVLTFLGFAAGFTQANLNLATYELSVLDQPLTVLLVGCTVYPFIIGVGGHFYKHCKGRIVVPICAVLGAYFFAKVSFVNPVEQRIIDNVLMKDKVSFAPCNDGVSKMRFFCIDAENKCDLYLESGKKMKVDYKGGNITLFHDHIKLVTSLGEVKGSFDGEKLKVGGGDWSLANVKREGYWMRGDVEVWNK